MGRKINPRTHKQHIIRVSGEAWKIIQDFKQTDEKIPHTIDRLFHYLKPQSDIILESEQKTRCINKLQQEYLKMMEQRCSIDMSLLEWNK
ncbi:MAG TPA: hypothetical protein VL854_10500 [Nitrososphaeraceae archaeon]|nr:hypothetical protein [Nitrososphaeraceae archaeon]